MARIRRGKQNEKDPRPIAVNDFIYDDPDDQSEQSPSDTPEEAVRKLRGRPAVSSSEDDSPESEGYSVPVADRPEEKSSSKKKRFFSSGIGFSASFRPADKDLNPSIMNISNESAAALSSSSLLTVHAAQTA